MTALQIPTNFTFAPALCGKRSSANRFCPWRTACAVFLLCLATAIVAPAQGFTSLVSFQGPNGDYPAGSLIQGIDGSLYGTTISGGTGENGPCSPTDLNNGCGTFFKVTPEGTLTPLYTFCIQSNCADGKQPQGGLAQGTDGNFYGTTTGGGANGLGTVFKITPGGELTTLHSFGSAPKEGGGFGSTLIQGRDGNLYGTTFFGGSNKYSLICPYSCGTVFKIAAGGSLTILHSFCAQTNCGDGAFPVGLIQATDGNFYGITNEGGNSISEGTLFKITPGGTLTVLYRFCAQSNCRDGGAPSGLVQDGNGNFYGTTAGGGANGHGTVFSFTPGGTLTTLHSFDKTDGAFPSSALIQATDGNLYGTTVYGGKSGTICGSTQGCGTVFKITPKGLLTTLYRFHSCTRMYCLDGGNPESALVQTTDGNFYGTTIFGGNPPCNSEQGCGTIFSLSIGLHRFVTFIRDSGKVGTTAQILGQGFKGTSIVSFNGAHAAFTVESDTYLTATVPDGATAGFVAVTTPSGTLTSNKKFRVVPQINGFAPTSGPVGTSVVITGSGFAGAIHAHFGGVLATSFTLDSDTQITATVPSGAITGKVSVCTLGENAQSATSFTVTP